jgi:nitrogenase molybdenum-iron protein alpha/beta subunit
MHRAKVNMVVCAKALLNVARKMEETFGIPLFEGSFYGVQDVSNALHDFARLIGDPDLMASTEVVIAREEDKARIRFLDINQEREFGYACYTGMVELARQLALSMESPVWEAVRKPAPWAKQSGPGSALIA